MYLTTTYCVINCKKKIFVIPFFLKNNLLTPLKTLPKKKKKESNTKKTKKDDGDDNNIIG